VKEQAQDSYQVSDRNSEIVETEGKKLAFRFTSFEDDDVIFGGRDAETELY